MAGTKSDLRRWLYQAKNEGATHLVIVCDTYDHDDYPVPVMPGEDAASVVSAYKGKAMQQVMEVYSLAMDIDEQVDGGRRVWNV